jgi:hypothetical protein
MQADSEPQPDGNAPRFRTLGNKHRSDEIDEGKDLRDKGCAVDSTLSLVHTLGLECHSADAFNYKREIAFDAPTYRVPKSKPSAGQPDCRSRPNEARLLTE